jgi:hypothetical protein
MYLTALRQKNLLLSFLRKGIALFVAFFLCFNEQARAQTDSCPLRISIITVSPTKDMYGAFGHTGLRTTDSLNNTDVIYNFAVTRHNKTVSYDEYITGQIKCVVGFEPFTGFLTRTKAERRGIIEQVLNLSCEQKQRFYHYLSEAGNRPPGFYNFQFNNCTSPVRDLLFTCVSGTIQKDVPRLKNASFRNIIHRYLNAQQRNWEKLIIDIGLGCRTDQPLPVYQAMFSANTFSELVDSTLTTGKQPLVKDKLVLAVAAKHPFDSPLMGPFYASLFILLAAIGVTLKQVYDDRQSFTGMVFDKLFFILTGLTGFFILWLWIFSDPYYYSFNFNILWAFPLNAVVALFSFKNPAFKKYCQLLLIINLLLLLLGLLSIQTFNNAVYLLSIAILLRSYFLYRY